MHYAKIANKYRLFWEKNPSAELSIAKNPISWRNASGEVTKNSISWSNQTKWVKKQNSPANNIVPPANSKYAEATYQGPWYSFYCCGYRESKTVKLIELASNLLA